MTINRSYKKFSEQLKTIYEEREANNIADWVFESIAEVKRLDRVTNKEKQIDDLTIQQLDNSLQQLLQHMPVQYVLGEAWFYKMKLKVNEHVLIPRPETEELVEWVVEAIRNKEVEELTTDNSQLTILDIGTGSGCIAIALKKELPNAEIMAIDVSKDALQVAKQNAQDQKAPIEFKQVNFLDEDSWSSFPSFQIIVSNPPYIPENEKGKLAKNVAEHEPHLALFVNEDPFIFYKKISDFAGTHLQKNGKIFVEVHEDYAKEVQQIFAEKNFIAEVKKDIFGRDRMLKAYR